MNAREKIQMEFDREYGKRLDAMRKRVAKAIGSRHSVIYAAYGVDRNDLPVDNLDKIAVKGACRFFLDDDGFFGDGASFASRPLKNPTWLRLCVVAERAIQKTGDYHHTFFEGVRYLGKRKGVKCHDLLMGS